MTKQIPDQTFDEPLPLLLECGCPGTQGPTCFGWCEMLAKMDREEKQSRLTQTEKQDD